MSSRFPCAVVILGLGACAAGCNERRTVIMEAGPATSTPSQGTTASGAQPAPASSASTAGSASSGTAATGSSAVALGPDFAGTGVPGFSGDGGEAVLARLDGPADVAVDAGGNAFVADARNSRVRRVDARTHVITTVAGDGTFGSSGDGGPATQAQLKAPVSVALDGAGNLYIADALDHRIRKVDAATGIITTLAGDGNPGFAGDGGPAEAALLNGPQRLRVTALADRVFIVDTGNHRIRKIQGGLMLTVVGNGTPGGVGAFGGDGGQAREALLDAPTGLAFDEQINLYIADTGNHRVRKMDWATGVLTTIAGDGTPGFAGDGGPAAQAQLQAPADLSFDPQSRALLLADAGNRRLRRIAAIDDPDATKQLIGTVAGDGFPALALSSSQLQRFTSPRALALDPALQGVLVVDTEDQRVRFVQLP